MYGHTSAEEFAAFYTDSESQDEDEQLGATPAANFGRSAHVEMAADAAWRP